MKIKKDLLTILAVLLCINLSAQTFFEQKDLMSTGVYYYPEHWPQHQWERDLKNIADHGFEFIHVAEFAWALFEPTEGLYDFGWLDKVIEIAAKNNLKVIIGTPTPCPPAWMGLKYPEIYLTDATYTKKEHGTRANLSLTNTKTIELTLKIVAEMGKHYGKNKNILGWQIDNEPEAKEDYSPSAQVAFRQWLKAKYTTIDSLNKAWGTNFWSQAYNSFDEISIHNQTNVGWWGTNPIALLDFKRFSADKQAEFLDIQAIELRKYISKQQFITTNYVAKGSATDPRRTKALDFASFTAYPNWGGNNMGDLGFRLGDISVLLYANDYYRSVGNVTGVMELQPGQVNWANHNSLLQPGTVRMWLWNCFGGGCSFACTYRYRQVLFGAEQFHHGIVTTDGITLSQGGQEYVQVMNEMKQLRKIYNPKNKMPLSIEKRKTAILWNYDNMWNLDNQKQTYRWNTWNHLHKYHSILKSLGAPVEFITEKDDFTKYDFIVVPAYQMVDEQLVAKWEKYAQNGGNILLTCRTAAKDKNAHLWESNPSGIINRLIGGKIQSFDMLPNGHNGTIDANGKQYSWSTWGELITPDPNTTVLAKYTDQFYSETACCLKNKIGNGNVWYIGVDADGDLEKNIVKQMFLEKNVNTTDYPQGIMVYWRDGFMVAVNYSSATYELPANKNAKFILGSSTLKPAEVSVWIEE